MNDILIEKTKKDLSIFKNTLSLVDKVKESVIKDDGDVVKILNEALILNGSVYVSWGANGYHDSQHITYEASLCMSFVSKSSVKKLSKDIYLSKIGIIASNNHMSSGFVNKWPDDVNTIAYNLPSFLSSGSKGLYLHSNQVSGFETSAVFFNDVFNLIDSFYGSFDKDSRSLFKKL